MVPMTIFRVFKTQHQLGVQENISAPHIRRRGLSALHRMSRPAGTTGSSPRLQPGFKSDPKQVKVPSRDDTIPGRGFVPRFSEAEVAESEEDKPGIIIDYEKGGK